MRWASCVVRSLWPLVLLTAEQSLIGLHVWSARSSYDVLGDFGWFYGACPRNALEPLAEIS